MSFVHDKEEQSFYDSYNNFIMSSDTKILAKLFSKYDFIKKTEYVPGDIVELGVFKGSGIYAWLKAGKIAGGINKKLYGFDIFDEKELATNIKTKDKEVMDSLFEDRNFSHSQVDYAKYLSHKLSSDGFTNFKLIKGDVSQTMNYFLDKNPGFRASIINFDLDIYQPTIDCLNMLWQRVTKGGILIFDEYAIPEWTESDAVDEFISDKNINLISTKIEAPSAYIIKT